jgi:hypothetical protein
MSDDWQFGKDLEGSGLGLVAELSRSFLRGTEENYENLR